ncbi:FtsX-like permease family protein [Actinoplanes sp. NEAU-A12]|uniref:FtsX-like permease family protein n=1 Tax=Actinoplanes sandaracinus TaxID=3045177 RepID=A0ABT6WKD3_9ACTN|nr:FtsX-like permease family protein [Actinoplanes sandaracinus]MDI6100193.1 FtsX-like permease family protein [Actinoplanes sandaracinus]
MGRVLLIGRLAVRDLRRRPVEAALLLLAVLAATTTLTLGLVLRNAAGDPYQNTREATSGPDVVVSAGTAAGLPDLERIAGAAGVSGHSGPFPVAAAKIEAGGRVSDVQAVGRDTGAAAIDQPALVSGGWVRDGGVVLEAAFAAAFGVTVGDRVTVNGRSFDVAGVAVTASMAPYPGSSCLVATGCASGPVTDDDLPPGVLRTPGLVWLTGADVRSLAPDTLAYLMSLKLAAPGEAAAFVAANDEGSTIAPGGPLPPRIQPWQEIQADATEVAGDSQILLMIGAWLLGLLAVASLSVLVGGRMADQTRRVGLLKAVGGTPGLVAVVLLAEYLLVAVVAAAAGLAIGALSAPLLTDAGAGLLGSAGTPGLTFTTIGTVTAAALAVAALATTAPALRAARSSTVGALSDPARPPRRSGWLIAVSARLPVPLLLALRVAARRPRRFVLAVTGVAVTVSGVYVVMILDAFLSGPSSTGYGAAQNDLLRRVLLTWTVILLLLAAVNAVVITWATVLDNRHTSALARALGATPREMTVALAAAQAIPALLGAVLGVFPAGFALFETIMAVTGGDGDRATVPPLWQLSAVVLATVLVVSALTAIPAHFGTRRPVTEALRAV